MAAEAFLQSAASMRHQSRPGIVDVTGVAAGPEGLAGVAQLSADVRTWVDLPDHEVEVLLFSLSAFIDKAGTGGGLFRQLLADGCADVARLTADVVTADLAKMAGRCAQAWTENCKRRDRARRGPAGARKRRRSGGEPTARSRPGPCRVPRVGFILARRHGSLMAGPPHRSAARTPMDGSTAVRRSRIWSADPSWRTCRRWSWALHR